MANLQKYPVRPAYAKLPSIPLPFNGVLTCILNYGMLLDVRCRQRSIMKRATQHWVASADRSYFPVYEVRPEHADATERLPAVLYYHGGAFTLTYSAFHVANLQIYANKVGCSVFLVDYRLSPKYVFPKALEDSFAALQWVIEKADWLHVDASRLAVMGDSAGGCLSASIAQKALDAGISLRGQGLIYPALDNRCSTESASQFTDAPVLTSASNRRMWEVYLPGAVHGTAPQYAVPAARENLVGLCAAYVETCEFDPLRDEGKAYALRLQESGVRVTENHTDGTVHGFDIIVRDALCEAALQARCDFLQSVFQGA